MFSAVLTTGRSIGIATFATSAVLACATIAAAQPAAAQRATEPPAGESAKSLAGSWQGVLSVGAVELRLVFNLAQGDDGKLTATMDSPDQGAKDLPIDSATLSGNQLTLEARRIGGAYRGTLAADGQKISGQWRQSGQTFPLDLARHDKAIQPKRPQEPTKPYPYTEREITIEREDAGIKLAGTLTLPPDANRAPAVVLITGSGAQDRDESILGHKPFLVIADALARRGIAVLRLDDRGVGGSTGDLDACTTQDLASDALAAVEFLKTIEQVHPQKIGLLGHSEGGAVAALAASQSNAVAFIIMLAGTGVNGEEIILNQGQAIARVQNANEQQIAAATELQKKLMAIAKRDTTFAEAHDEVLELMRSSAAYRSAATPELRAAIEAQIAAQVETMFTPWFRSFLTYDPATALKRVRCPVLALNGQKDLQVDPRLNLPPIANALRAAGNRDATVRELPDLNHLFQHAETGSPVEYGKIEETVAPEVLQLVGDWILERSR